MKNNMKAERIRKICILMFVVMILTTAFTAITHADTDETVGEPLQTEAVAETEADEEAEEEDGMFTATAWSLLPPVIAIGLALLTKEVYSSLFIGIVAGGLMVTGFKPLKTVDVIINDGIVEALKGLCGNFRIPRTSRNACCAY